MEDLKELRRMWSADHKKLRKLFEEGTRLQEAKELFQSQHAIMHSQQMSGLNTWSYADKIFNGLGEDQLREIPTGNGHSLLWIVWHTSRIEDMTMNILVGNKDQVYYQDDWNKKLNSPIHHSGNEISPQDLKSLSNEVTLEHLFAYRNSVGRETKRIVNSLSIEDLTRMPESDQLDRILKEGAVLPEAQVIIDYWSRRKVFQLLLMPPTRHLMVHLNEGYELRKRLIK